MNPKYLASLLSVLIACCGCAATNPYASVCQITTDGGSGSGAVIAIDNGKALILTCRHVAQGVDRTVKLEWLALGDVSAIGKVVSIVPGSNFNTDLALIVCDAPKGIQALPVAKFNKHTGPWRSIGFRYSVMYESIALEAEEAAGLIQVSEPYIKGMSGGPVLDGSGAVVGVVVGTDSMPGSAVGRSFGLAANGEYLAALIAAHSE